MAVVVIAVFLVIGLFWLRYSTSGLPDVEHLKNFAPSEAAVVHDECVPMPKESAPVEVIPGREMGEMIRGAVLAAEQFSTRSTAFSYVIRGELGYKGKRPVSMAIARTVLCQSRDRPLKRQFVEIRTAIQLDRRFSEEDLLTIFLNRVWAPRCGYGLQATARCLYRKDPANLDAAQAATIAGMIRSPSTLSPFADPDRALSRRNVVLDAMAANGQLNPSDLASAKAQPLFH